MFHPPVVGTKGAWSAAYARWSPDDRFQANAVIGAREATVGVGKADAEGTDTAARVLPDKMAVNRESRRFGVVAP